MNVIIDTAIGAGFFNGSYSKTFTVPKSGYYIIHDSWAGVFKRVENQVSVLSVKIDNAVKAQYVYCSTPSDEHWGSTRRTITGQDILVYLDEGEHSISAAGNLYWDADYYPKYHYIYASFFSE